MAALLGNSTVAIIAVVMHMRPWAIPLAMTTMRKSIYMFAFLFYVSMGLCLVGWSSAINQGIHNVHTLFKVFDNLDGYL